MTIKLHGKEYVTVAERVAAAHEDPAAEFAIVGGDIITAGTTERWWYQATIRVRGRCFIGTAEIKFNAKPGTPDADNPLECAETSAIGRALAFAGVGTVEGIASADEVQRAAPRRAAETEPANPPHPATSPEPRSLELARLPATEDQVRAISRLREQLGPAYAEDPQHPDSELTREKAANIIRAFSSTVKDKREKREQRERTAAR